MADTAVELIAAFLLLRDENTVPDDCTSQERMDSAAALLHDLTAAGYRILGPDDLDKVTVERCEEIALAEVNRCLDRSNAAQVARSRSDMFRHNTAFHSASTIAIGIRALTGGEDE